MTSLLTPDANQLRLFTGFSDWGSVVEEVDVQTHRLDDLDIDDFDLLKIDIQGAELMVFQHGRERLRNAVAVQTEVSFVPLYRDQPTFGDVDRELRSQGFVPHSMPAMKEWAIARRRCSTATFASRAINCSRPTSFMFETSLTRNPCPVSNFRTLR